MYVPFLDVSDDLCLTRRLRELFIRTYQLQWMVARYGLGPSGEQEATDIAILPKSVGKEGSLVDADSTYTFE